MTDETRCYGISAGCHVALLALFALMTASAITHREVVTIDFNLESPAEQCTPAQPSPPVPVPPSPQPPRQEPLRQTVVQAPDPVPMTPAAVAPVEPATPTIATPAMSVTAQKLEGTAAPARATSAVQHASPSPAPVAGPPPDRESLAEQGRKKYLKEHFAYIRELIIKRLSYPAVARRMEWSGKVVLAFVVGEDGGVSSVRLKESSGYPVLDNSAMETVRSVAPFPRPPVAAEIVMPVLFRLQ